MEQNFSPCSLFHHGLEEHIVRAAVEVSQHPFIVDLAKFIIHQDFSETLVGMLRTFPFHVNKILCGVLRWNGRMIQGFITIIGVILGRVGPQGGFHHPFGVQLKRADSRHPYLF